MQEKNLTDSDLIALYEKLKESQVPEELVRKVSLRLEQLDKIKSSAAFLPEYDRYSKYIEWITKIPFNAATKDSLDLVRARKALDKHHHGLEEIKNRVLEYLSVMKMKQEKGEGKEIMRAPILCFVGLVGTGKTTIASSIAEAMGRKYARIPFGGMGDPLDLRGMSKLKHEAEPGKVIKALVATQSKNPVILLDEIDRVTTEGRASIMGVLVELLDPVQNVEFVDHYVDFPVDLSQALFIATANNTHHIATAVLDRLEPIRMPSYTDKEKIVIGKDYVLPKKLGLSGLPENSLIIDDSVWPNIVRPLGYDAGIRTLERTIDGVVRKVAKLVVEGKLKSVKVTPENVKKYLPR